jgi:DNA helicase-2/ATP-dependent DNA helicase PcrA
MARLPRIRMEIDEQRERILAAYGHLLIEGGPGSGKTTIALVKAGRALPTLAAEQRVLFLSFSRAAVRQILERTDDVLGYSDRDLLEVRTFHAFFMEVVRSHSALLTGRPATFVTPDRESHQHADFDGPGSWREWTQRLAQEGTFVFDMLAPTAAAVLERWVPVRHLYQRRYPLVIVDEFQDTNEDQWRAVRWLAEGSTVICLADPEQRIYDFVEGVSETRIDDLVAELQPERFDLSADNFRSPQGGILRFANAVGRNTPAEAPDTIVTVKYRHDYLLRSHFVVHAVRQKLAADLGREPTVAVLAPTNRFISQISVALSEDATFGDRDLPVIEHVLHLDHALMSSAAYVVASLLEWPSAASHEGVVRTLHLMADFYRVKFANGTAGARSQIDAVLRAAEAIHNGKTPRTRSGKVLLELSATGLELRGRPIRDWALALSKLTGAAELVEVAKSARLLRVVRVTDPVSRTLGETWDGVGAYRDASLSLRRFLAEEMVSVNERAAAPTQLMNMHKSKGKEFDGVVIVEGAHHSRLLNPDWPEKQQAAARRLLRVALTRARLFVVLVRPEDASRLTPAISVEPLET